MSPAMMEKNCACCGKAIQVRVADHKRGWGNFCSKRCKAVKQEGRTDRYAAYCAGQDRRNERAAFDQGCEPSWDDLNDPEHAPECRPANSAEELSLGGHGDARHDEPFHVGKF